MSMDELSGVLPREKSKAPALSESSADVMDDE